MYDLDDTLTLPRGSAHAAPAAPAVLYAGSRDDSAMFADIDAVTV